MKTKRANISLKDKLKSKMHLASRISFCFVLTVATVLLYQNCGESFQASRSASTSEELYEVDQLMISENSSGIYDEIYQKISNPDDPSIIPAKFDREKGTLSFVVKEKTPVLIIYTSKNDRLDRIDNQRKLANVNDNLKLTKINENKTSHQDDMSLYTYSPAQSQEFGFARITFRSGSHRIVAPRNSVDDVFIIDTRGISSIGNRRIGIGSGSVSSHQDEDDSLGGANSQSNEGNGSRQPTSEKEESSDQKEPAKGEGKIDDGPDSSDNGSGKDNLGDKGDIKPTASQWFKRPFNNKSAQWRPIGTGAQYAGNDAATTSSIKTMNQFNINHDNVYGAAAHLSSPNAPWVTIKHNGSLGGVGLPYKMQLAANQPFFNETVGDRQFAVLNPTTFIVDAFYGFHRSTLTASLHKQYDIRGLGHGTKLNERMSMSASGAAVLFGAIRAFEIETPGYVIQHIHHIAVPRLSSHRAMYLGRRIQWPATAADALTNLPENNNGPLAYGSLLALPPVSKGGPDLDKLSPPLSEAGRRIFQAFRDYGVIVVDGAVMPAFRVDGPMNYALVRDLKSDLANHFKHLREVTNSVEGATAKVHVGSNYTSSGSLGKPTFPAGGGSPLAPNIGYPAP